MKFKEVIRDILVESDKRDTIQKVLGFSKDWADEFHSMDEKLSIWIANTFLQQARLIFPAEGRGDKTNLIKRLNNSNPGVSYWANDYKLKYQYILDWVKSPRRTGNLDLKNLSFNDAYSESREWHESLEANIAASYEEKNEILIDYRDTKGVGYYWVNLNTSFSEEEKQRMGHCGNDTGKILFSLRSIDDEGSGRSHLTVSYDSKTNKIHQVKGRKNSKPKPDYYEYIIDLIRNSKLAVKGFERRIYAYESNFQLNDLSTEVLNGLFNDNKDLKMDYLFGDKTEIAENAVNPDLALYLDTSFKEKVYGIVNKETLTLYKDFEYKIDNESRYTDILYNMEKGPGHAIVLKHFKSIKSKDNFIIKQTKKSFDFITKEEAEKLEDWD